MRACVRACVCVCVEGMQAHLLGGLGGVCVEGMHARKGVGHVCVEGMHARLLGGQAVCVWRACMHACQVG